MDAPPRRSSVSNLEPPPAALDKAERKRSHRVPPPPAPVDVPEPVDAGRGTRRPPSPLRNSYTPDDASESGSDDQDDDARLWGPDPSSPSPSIKKMASEFAHRVGALVGSAGSRSSSKLPSQAELEAEAEREREKSRREAEMIMRREAEERRIVEDGVFAMMENSSQNPPLQAPPPRSQTMSSSQSSPSSSPKEKENWFTAVKNKLTPIKEPLTPAQQIIQETKAKEKVKKKEKGKEKSKESIEWPATPSRKFSDPAFLQLATSASPEPVTPPRPVAQSGMMTPSPGRSIDSARDTPPLYAQFNGQGILDVPDTLLTIARRFEKLERWTVSHVRALEERMSDVERWLVEKEKEEEKEDEAAAAKEECEKENEKSSFHSEEDEGEERVDDLADIREELVELQGRVGELGREMAKLMTAPPNLASKPARHAIMGHSKYTSQTASGPTDTTTIAPASFLASAFDSTPTSARAPEQTSNAPTTAPTAAPVMLPTPTSTGPRTLPTVPVSTSRSVSTTPARPKEASSPPAAQRSSSVLSSGSGRTRLPYPTGDYTSPPGLIPTKQDVLSPTSSPPSSSMEESRKRPMSVTGLPSGGSIFQASQSTSPSTSGLPYREASIVRALSPSSKPSTGTSPISGAQRQPSVSPTPRKRYTVALGQPISAASAAQRDDYDWRQSRNLSLSSASGTDVSTDDDGDRKDSRSDASEDDDGEARAIDHSHDDTIGNSESYLANDPTMPNGTLRRGNSTTSPPRQSPGSRIRAQSSYGPPSGYNLSMLSSPDDSPSPVAPLRPRVRSKSIDRIGLGISLPGGNGRFIDPLVLRREQEPKTPKTPKFERGKKVPVNELVAFFDQELQR